jgi:Phospholipase_D-nuclease N-terminal
VLASDYPLLDILWTLGVFFAFLIWIWLLVKVIADIVRRWRFGGPAAKALWIIFVVAFPYLAVWVYLFVRVLVDDLLPRNDLTDGAKALWIVGFVLLPLVGVVIYLLSQRTGMSERGTRLAKVRGDG